MGWFNRRLYVGTGRNVLCVEYQTVDFYFPYNVERLYAQNPQPGVRCNPDPYDLDQRAEIWEYRPTSRRWRRVFRSPADVGNPRASGKRLSREFAFRGMTAHRDRRGRTGLFAGGVTSNEYVPEIARRHPPRLLRSRDGRRFTAIPGPRLVRSISRFGGVARPMGFRSMLTYKGKLFVTASTGLTGDGVIFRVDRPFSRRPRFRQVSRPDMRVFEMKVYKGALYAGTGDNQYGYGVWKLAGTGRPFKWTPVVTNGAGRGAIQTSVLAMDVFRGRLYVSAVGWYQPDVLPSTELIRIDRRGGWEVVVGAARNAPDGRPLAPISGLGDGFENGFNAHLWRMVHQDGALYVGTLDWSWLMEKDKSWARELSPFVRTLLGAEYGLDVWASCDGRDWFPVTRDGFGDRTLDFGARNMVASRSGFYVGSANHAQGTTVWHDHAPACQALPGQAARARGASVAAPRRLLTDVQRDGTVVSWEPSRSARAYRVLRSEYIPLSFSYFQPRTDVAGFRLENAPIPAAAGTPGASAFQGSVGTPYEEVGTTAQTAFVDRGARRGTRYAYQVEAVPVRGATAARSNVQVVPDPRPPATWAELQSAMGGDAASASAARTRRRRGERAGAVAAVARIRRVGSGDERVQELAYRLERRLRYSDLAGGR